MATTKDSKAKTFKSIDDVPTKLKQSELYKSAHYATLINDTIAYVLPFWNSKWRFTSQLSGIVNKRKLTHEIEESLPVLHFVFKMINDIIKLTENNNKFSINIPIIDLCSGKGILSILIASFIKLVPEYQHLYQYIDCIYLVDRSWFGLNFIEKKEMTAKKEDYTKEAKCPIKACHLQLISNEFGIKLCPIRTNIHNQEIIHFLNQFNKTTILLSIHLCRRLSVRAIKLFNVSKNVYGFLLAPCCLPLRGGYNIRVGPLWNKTYHLWKNKNKNNMDINKQYLIHGITPYSMDGNEDEMEMKEKDKNNNDETDKCCFQLALLSNKQIHKRGKKLGNKFELNAADIDKLNECKKDYNKIDIDNQENEIFIASEMIPKHLFDVQRESRYNQWITFLFNCIDTNDNQKNIYRVPLTGNEHRCDAYLTVRRS